MKIALSEHFTYKKIFKFTLPSVLMMVFTSIYGVVDGFFVSNFVGETAFTAVNFIMPFLMIMGAFGFMFGTGGSALVAKVMGVGDKERANRLFSMFVYVSIGFGIFLSVLGVVAIRPIAAALGASGQMLEDCVLYGTVILVAIPSYMLQYEFQSFFIVAEKPQLGFITTLIAGGMNMVLDALFVAVIPLGLAGAALATAFSATVGGVIPLVYFMRKNNTSTLRIVKTGIDFKALMRGCANGSSELMSNISMSLVGMLYNTQLMHYAGEEGVAAYGVLMYVNMIFLAIFIGYSVGMAPVVSYHYGAGNTNELKNVRKKSFVIIGISSVLMFVLSEVLAKPLSLIFVSYSEELLSLTVRGFLIYSFTFLFVGFAIYSSTLFTALNNGLVSAVISFLRTLVFQILAVMIFPILWDVDGIWVSVVFAELMAAAVGIFFIWLLKKKYKY